MMSEAELFEIYQRAAQFEDTGERRAFLADACGDPEALGLLLDMLSPHSGSGPRSRDGVPLATAELQSLFPQSVGRYRITGLLGIGGMGVVYRAEHPKDLRSVAIKVIRPERVSLESVDRFLAEARIQADLHHTNIAQIFDIDSFEDSQGVERPYMVMELITDCVHIDEHVHRSRSTPAEVALMIQAVAEGLAEAHRNGVVHRDLKPSNILVDEAGRPKIIDFGIARLVAECSRDSQGLSFGTVRYMSPEQMSSNGASGDERSDVYSLGKVMHELLCGWPAHWTTGKHLAELRQIVQQPVAPPSSLNPAVPRELDDIVLQALEVEPADRQSSAGELATALAQLEPRARAEAPSLEARSDATKWAGRAALTLLGLVLGYFIATRIGQAGNGRRVLTAKEKRALLIEKELKLIAAKPLLKHAPPRPGDFVVRLTQLKTVPEEWYPPTFSFNVNGDGRGPYRPRTEMFSVDLKNRWNYKIKARTLEVEDPGQQLVYAAPPGHVAIRLTLCVSFHMSRHPYGTLVLRPAGDGGYEIDVSDDPFVTLVSGGPTAEGTARVRFKGRRAPKFEVAGRPSDFEFVADFEFAKH